MTIAVLCNAALSWKIVDIVYMDVIYYKCMMVHCMYIEMNNCAHGFLIDYIMLNTEHAVYSTIDYLSQSHAACITLSISLSDFAKCTCTLNCRHVPAMHDKCFIAVLNFTEIYSN